MYIRKSGLNKRQEKIHGAARRQPRKTVTSVQFVDAVDIEGKVRSADKLGLFEDTVRDSFVALITDEVTGNVYEEAGRMLAGNGVVGGIEDVERTGLDGGDRFINLLLSAGSAGLAKLGDHNGVIGITGGEISRDLGAVLDGIEQIAVEEGPVVLGRGQSGIGRNVEHIYVVTDGIADGAFLPLGLSGGGHALAISMLTDDDAACIDEGLTRFLLGSGIGPRVREGDIHGDDIADNVLHAKEERGITGDNFGIGESTDITGLDLTVSVIVLIGELAAVDELLQFHTGDNTGDEAGLIGVRENVVQVLQTGSKSVGSRHSDELDALVLTGSLLSKARMTEGIGDNELAALLYEVGASIVALRALGDVGLDDHVLLGKTLGGSGGLEAVDVSLIVTDGFVMDADKTDLEYVFVRFLAAASAETKDILMLQRQIGMIGNGSLKIV